MYIMKKVLFITLCTLLMATSFTSCRETNEDEKTAEELVEEMEAEGADIKKKVDDDETKIKMETENKEVKIKTEDGESKIKIKTENDDA
tara:strand:+ start:364 stop:630 length:267 start_codon:yes stop_codon:yes gene_type:complete